MRYNRISADCHLDMPWMPPTLFVENASRELKDRMPYVTDGPDGPMWVTKSGANFGLKNGVGPSGAKLVPGQNRRVDIMAETGLFADGEKDIRRVSDPHLRAKDMDRDGVDAEVIFGILGSASKLQDHAAAAEMFRIYNDWLKDFCSALPGPPYRSRLPAVWRRRVGGAGDPSLRQDGPEGAGAVLLVGHGADVASVLGAAVEGGR